MVAGEEVEPGPDPPNMYNEQWGFLGPVVVDTAGGKEFGAGELQTYLGQLRWLSLGLQTS